LSKEGDVWKIRGKRKRKGRRVEDDEDDEVGRLL